MKSCLALLCTLLILALLILGGALWRMNYTAEVSRRVAPAAH